MGSRRILFGALVAIAAACSSYGTEVAESPPPKDDAGTSDASDERAPNDSGGGGDAGTGGCVPTDPFDSQVDALGLGESGVAVADARLSLDETTIVYKRRSLTPGDGGATTDLFLATRPSVGSPFSPPTALESLASTGESNAPTLSPNGLTLVYSRYNGPGSSWDLTTATRASSTSPFVIGGGIPGANAGSNTTDFYPYLSHDGSRLYFTSSRSATTILDVAVGTGEIPQSLPRQDPAATDFAPVLTGDALTLYFARTSAGELTNINAPSMIYVSHRRTSTDAFDSPAPATEINVLSARNLPSWISPDACRLYFTSSRGGRLDVYVAHRTPR